MAAPPAWTTGGPDRVGPGALAAIQRVAGNRAAVATVQRTRQTTADQEAPTQQAPTQQTPGQQTSEPEGASPADEVIRRLSVSIGDHAIQKKRKFNFWEPQKQWPEAWLTEKAGLRWALERRLVRGEPFRPEEIEDIATLSSAQPGWLKDIGIGTLEEGRKNAAGLGGKNGKKGSGKGAQGAGGPAEDGEARADYSNWLKLTPGRRILAATLAFQTQAPQGGAHIPDNPAYTLGRFMRAQSLPPDDPERRALEGERDEQIRETAVDTLFPDGVSEDRLHPAAQEHRTPERLAQDSLARTVLTNVLLVLRHGLQVLGDDGRHVDYREGDVIRALAHGGRVNIRIPALRDGGQPHQILDALGVTDDGVRRPHVVKRDYATHRATISPNEDDELGAFEEQGGVGASIKNKVGEYVPGMTSPELLGVNISGGGFGTKDWNGDVVLPDGSYGHMLLVFTAPTAERDGSLLVGIETVAPHARSPVGYHHGVRSTEATANPESVLHGHKQDKIGSGKMKANQRLVELRRTGGQDWHAFLETIKQEWADRLQAAGTTEQKRLLYQELVGRRG